MAWSERLPDAGRLSVVRSGGGVMRRPETIEYIFVGVCGLIAIILITLKLYGVIAWPWFVVSVSLWLPVVGWVFVLCLMGFLLIMDRIISWFAEDGG